jgi:hypothetical protein
MTTAAMIRQLQKIDTKAIQEIGVLSVQDNEGAVVDDSLSANAYGQTFSSTSISRIRPFSDWFETGEFAQNLKFASETDINFASSGDGAEAIFSAFSYDETIAPHFRTLSTETMDKIRQSFIKHLKARL